MGTDERAGSHIWLRQSVRFTVGDQRRTLEIALPVPVGAAPEEIERLLQEADAGMTQLTRHLDQRVAAALGETAAVVVSSSVEAAARVPPVDAPTQPASRDPVASPPPIPRAGIHEEREVPSAPDAAVHAERPTAKAPPPASQSAPPMPSPAPAAASIQRPTSPATPSAPLSRPEFLAETRAIGLTPPQVMERLGVRSLDGLDLHESLALLRRQQAPAADAAAGAPGRSAVAREAAPTAPLSDPAPPDLPAGSHFDEEDDYDLTVIGPESEGADYGAPETDELANGEEEMSDEFDLEDVPDFGAPTPISSAHRGATASRPAAEDRAATGAWTQKQRARARELVARLRAIAPGGSAIRSQHTAFDNIVADQLGKAPAEALTRGLWSQPPARLGTEQLNAVIQWGKADDFADEAPVVLALLRAEQAAANDAAAQSAPSRSTRAADRRAPEAGARGEG